MNKALTYAEETLGVHKVNDEAKELLKELDEQLGALDTAIDERRSLDEKIDDRQMDILISERGQNAELSQAAMDRRLKEVYHKDQGLRDLRSRRNAAAGVASGLELDIEHTKYRLKVAVGRMHELGGYFQYLAAVKNAESTPVQYAEASTSGQPAAAGGETTHTGESQ